MPYWNKEITPAVNAMSESLKERKEDFVTGLTGSSTLDVYLVTSVSAASYLIWCIIKKKTSTFDDPKDISGTIVDFLLNWNNLLLSVTVCADSIPLLLFVTLLPMVKLNFLEPKNKTKKPKPSRKTKKSAKATTESEADSTTRIIQINYNTLAPKEYLPFKSYITVYRSQMMIITCLCILAVDFKIFPRRFAKVETWGTSVMDLGVGSFAFSMGVISARGFLRQFFTGTYSYKKNLVSVLKGIAPVLALGSLRLFLVKFLNYQEHVTEYGKDWNFFFTLGFLPLICSVVSPLIFLITPWGLSIVVSLVYEYALVKKGLMEYILTAPRTNFLSDNREGIFSLIGYFAIFLNGLALGSIVMTVAPAPKNLLKLTNTKDDLLESVGTPSKFTLTPMQGLAIFSGVFQVLYILGSLFYGYAPSRRMTNLMYVLWVSAYNCTFLMLYKAIERYVYGEVKIKYITTKRRKSDIKSLTPDETVPVSLIAVNQNSLVIFLVSNILTGFVNMSYNTLDSNKYASLLVLMGYEVTLSAFSLALYYNGVRLR